MPMESKMLDTTRSITRNGRKSRKPIWKAVFSSLRTKAGTTTTRVTATLDARSVGVVDVVIVFVKCYHTENAVRAALPMIGDDTVVLSLQNGWGNATPIANIVGAERTAVGGSGVHCSPSHWKGSPRSSVVPLS